MTLLLCLFIVLCASVSIPAVSVSTNTSDAYQKQSTVTEQNIITSSDIMTLSNQRGDAAPTTQTPDSGLSTLAFGVISFILILIIVMVILVTVVNFRGWCGNTKEDGVKNYGSVISEGQIRNTGERESIMLVSVRTLNTDMDTDSLRLSSIYSTAPDSEYQ